MNDKEKIKILRNALIGLVGVSIKEELEAMEATLSNFPIPDVERMNAGNAIRALIETAEEDTNAWQKE